MAPTKKDTTKKHPNVAARVLPHNDDAEMALLCCALIDEDAPITIFADVKPEDFYVKAHQDIYQAMLNLSLKDRPIDFVTLVQETEEMGVTESVGGISYLSSLTNYVPNASNCAHYLKIVKKNSLLRQIIASNQKIMDVAYSVDADEDALALAEREVFALGEKQNRRELVKINEAIKEAMDEMDEKQSNPTEQKTVPIPFEGLNDLLGGFHPGTLVIIAARPGQGKTSLGMNFISHAALSTARKTPTGKVDPYKCAVFSLEMTAKEIATRLLCSVARVSMATAKKGTRTVDEIKALVQAQQRLNDADIYIDDSSLTTPVEILSKCRRLKRERGLDLVMIDYLQLMSSGKRVENRQQEVTEITRSLKIASKELGVPILLLSQMSRDIEKREDKTPQMADLRESGAIEQDADIIMFLHRKKDKDDLTVSEDERTRCEIMVKKHRAGAPGDFTVRWHGEFTTFTDLNEKPQIKDNSPTGPQFKNAGNFEGAVERETIADKSADFDKVAEPIEEKTVVVEKEIIDT
ncbi:MAG: replicative DNA helicase, partial [Clostridia bacterium]|nr:replicative DNA helicase [Clostridia bacterium]